jgi:hypothetical protein
MLRGIFSNLNLDDDNRYEKFSVNVSPTRPIDIDYHFLNRHDN